MPCKISFCIGRKFIHLKENYFTQFCTELIKRKYLFITDSFSSPRQHCTVYSRRTYCTLQNNKKVILLYFPRGSERVLALFIWQNIGSRTHEAIVVDQCASLPWFGTFRWVQSSPRSQRSSSLWGEERPEHKGIVLPEMDGWKLFYCLQHKLPVL